MPIVLHSTMKASSRPQRRLHLLATLAACLWACACADPPASSALHPPADDVGPDTDVADADDDANTDLDTGDANTDIDDDDANTDADTDTPEDVGPPPPLEATLTINELPPEMNGSSAAFTLTLPTEGFTLDLAVTGGAGVELEGVAATVDGTPLTTSPTATPGGFRFRVLAEDHLAPSQNVELCATVTDADGQRVTPECLLVHLVERTPQTDPFPAPETWLVILSRDQFSPDPDTSVSPPRLYSAEGADGVPDLDQTLDLLGVTSGGADPELDALTRARLLARIRQLVHGIFLQDTDDPIAVHVLFEGDPDAPDPRDFAPNGEFSMIALGGDVPRRRQDETFVGRAEIDWNNQVRNDDTALDLGVFVTSIARQAIAHPAGFLILGKSSPLLGGTPFGLHPMDATILAEGAARPDSGELQNRQDYYTLLLDLLSLALGATLAHEMGHSLGLVPPGYPPQGLFAGLETLPFPGSTIDDAHIDTPGLNVMQTGAVTDYLEAIRDRRVSFNPLNRAWLRRQLLVIRP